MNFCFQCLFRLAVLSFAECCHCMHKIFSFVHLYRSLLLRRYSYQGDGNWADANGNSYRTWNDEGYHFGNQLEQHELQGSNGTVNVIETTNGDYYYCDADGVGYTDNGDGTWTDENGNIYTE